MKTKEKGYSLIVLIIAIIVILIITSGVISKINLSQEEKAINNFIYDMNTITEVARQYYSSTGTIPSLGKVNPPAEIGTQLNENDGETYHQVDLKKLKLTDIHEPNEEYIINEESLVVYRLKGISYKGETYYTVTDELMGKLGKYERQDLEVAYAVSPTTWTRTANIKITIPSEVDATISDWTFKWNVGPKDVAFFQDSGHSFSPSEAFAVSQNGVYSVYIKDDQGKETIKNIIVNNVDDLAPKYQIEEDGTITLRDDETGIHEVRYKLKSEYDKNQSGRTPLDAYLEGGKGDTIEDLKNDIYVYYQTLEEYTSQLNTLEANYQALDDEQKLAQAETYTQSKQELQDKIKQLQNEYAYILDENIEYVLYVEDYAMNGTVITEGNLTFGKVKAMFNIPEKGEKTQTTETITFTIAEGNGYWGSADRYIGTHTVPKGMTWKEYVESEKYNPTIYFSYSKERRNF